MTKNEIGDEPALLFCDWGNGREGTSIPAQHIRGIADCEDVRVAVKT